MTRLIVFPASARLCDLSQRKVLFISFLHNFMKSLFLSGRVSAILNNK